MPSVSMASASGANFNFTVCGSPTFGHEKVPCSNRLIKEPQPRAIPRQDLQAAVPAIGEDQERPPPRIFAQPLAQRTRARC